MYLSTVPSGTQAGLWVYLRKRTGGFTGRLLFPSPPEVLSNDLSALPMLEGCSLVGVLNLNALFLGM